MGATLLSRCEKVSWALSGNVSLMKVCLFRGRATTVLSTAQPVPAYLPGNNSPRFQELSDHSIQIPLGLRELALHCKSMWSAVCSVPSKWAVLQADIVEGTAEHGVYLNPSRAKVH